MIEMTLDEVAQATGGVLVSQSATPSSTVSGTVTTDSRDVQEGSIFFAKPGEFDDGHNYLAQALDRGASLAVVERVSDHIPLPQIVVPGVVNALSNLAQYVLERVREKTNLRVVGITGSNGKTSTKNMLAAILASRGKTIAPVASFNNEVGAPLTVLRIDFDTEFLIVELGAAGVGSIARLAKMTRPDIGVELKVGFAHAGVFGGLEVTKEIKAELLPFVRRITVLNFDDPNVMSMTPVTEFATFGFETGADYQIVSPEISLLGTSCEILHDGKAFPMRLQVLGEHQLYNAAAAIAVAASLGVEVAEGIRELERLELAERWRMQLLHRADGVKIINDAYNASPDSMRAALQTLATLGRQGHRTVAVLGTMAELGEYANDAHDAIGRLVVRYNIDQLFVIGEEAKLIHMGAMQEGSWDGESVFIADASEAVGVINPRLHSGDVVLVKSSNSAGLRFIGDRLAEA